ncbi:hypothetical protein BDV10DRAFT_118781 [Aspergillus recurvatus]
MNGIVCVRVTLLPHDFITVVLHFFLKPSMGIAVMSCILLPLRMLSHRAEHGIHGSRFVFFPNNAYATRGSYLVGITVHLPLFLTSYVVLVVLSICTWYYPSK